VVEAVQELNLSIPADVSFLKYEDFASTRFTPPFLTVIAQPVYDMGSMAARPLSGGSKAESPPSVPAPSAEALASRPKVQQRVRRTRERCALATRVVVYLGVR